MKNYEQPGAVVTVTAPANVASGAGVLVGALFGVAQTAALSGAPVEIVTEGVVSLAKVAGSAINEGVRVFWDDTAKNVTATLTGNYAIGWAVGPGNYASAVTAIKVKLGRPNLVAT